MEGLAKLRLDKIKYYVNRLIPAYLVRQTVPATDIQVLEPAEMRYDCPPDDGAWQKLDMGGPWGGKQQYAYFRGKVTVPSHWKGNPIELRIVHKEGFLEPTHDDNTTCGPEGQAFINGQRVGAIDKQHKVVRYPFKAGQTYDVRAVFFAARCRCRHSLEAYGLNLLDAATCKLYHDMRVALEMIDRLDAESLDRARLIDAVDAGIKALDTRDAIGGAIIPNEMRRDAAGEGFYASVAAAQKAFDKIRKQVQDSPGAGEVLAVGHAHIDLGWLWPIAVTHHKCVRTFATQVRLLKEYPDWVYQQSSPQTYKWMEKDAPELLVEIKKLIKAGRWEAEGATWCECDMNITGSESLARQFLYGKKYFAEKLGVDSRYLWLPDVFGYSAALPQLLKLADCDAFITSKISWNEFNRFPYDTFRWRGLDGSEIPVQFITTACDWWFFTYNSMLNVEELKGNWQKYQQKGITGKGLLSFGYGDGGGGPTELMLESGKRLANEPTPAGLPKLRYGQVRDLVQEVKAKAPALPVWDGELYLELHRGTYTTQGWIKRANRKNEIRLHNLEWLGVLAGKIGHKLDKAALDSLWEDLLLMQFHDILPGSSVGELYDETRGMHEKLAGKADEMTGDAAKTLAGQIDTSAAKKPVALFNTLSWDRTDPDPSAGRHLDRGRHSSSRRVDRCRRSCQTRRQERPVGRRWRAEGKEPLLADQDRQARAHQRTARPAEQSPGAAQGDGRQSLAGVRGPLGPLGRLGHPAVLYGASAARPGVAESQGRRAGHGACSHRDELEDAGSRQGPAVDDLPEDDHLREQPADRLRHAGRLARASCGAQGGLPG